jgi:hypothetical protein
MEPRTKNLSTQRYCIWLQISHKLICNTNNNNDMTRNLSLLHNDKRWQQVPEAVSSDELVSACNTNRSCFGSEICKKKHSSYRSTDFVKFGIDIRVHICLCTQMHLMFQQQNKRMAHLTHFQSWNCIVMHKSYKNETKQICDYNRKIRLPNQIIVTVQNIGN